MRAKHICPTACASAPSSSGIAEALNIKMVKPRSLARSPNVRTWSAVSAAALAAVIERRQRGQERRACSSLRDGGVFRTEAEPL
jgi:hypothetical protein